MSNSHLAFEASEFAREKGVFDSFHTRVFEAYFVEGKNIGDKSVILDLAQGLGLNIDELSSALSEHRYQNRLEEVQKEKIRYGIIGTPTFIIGNTKLIGLQNYDALRQAVRFTIGD
ncbi:MAG TPA: DsbA family protein [Thermodesulfobacteriota bacterium]|nr:DsbA family protein [Thermodesulfobacteriota bacterium]